MFLDAKELIELTKRQRCHAQRAVLNALGIQYKVRPDGSLAVLKSHVEKEFGAEAVNKPTKRVQPNWGAMKNAQKA